MLRETALSVREKKKRKEIIRRFFHFVLCSNFAPRTLPALSREFISSINESIYKFNESSGGGGGERGESKKT